MSRILDALDFQPDRFLVAPKHEWFLVGMGNSRRTGTQPRFCAPNCKDYIKDKDFKCGIFYECTYFVFDMHKITEGESMVCVSFATEEDPPYDGLGWWVSEEQLVKEMGREVNGEVDMDLGRKLVNKLIRNYINSPSSKGVIIS